MSEVRLSVQEDLSGWLCLAREVEPMFGPMADEPEFIEGLKVAIANKTAICCVENLEGDSTLLGGVVVFPEINAIAWLAISEVARGRGIGSDLLKASLGLLDESWVTSVATFASHVPEGRAAIRLYGKYGFEMSAEGSVNPAGIPTMIMNRAIK